MIKDKKDAALLPEKSEKEKKRAMELLNLLYKEYPDAHCALNHTNPFELLVATILSAQCTDERVNKVTPELFRQYPTPGAMAEAPLPDIEEFIKSTGFYHNKAKSLKAASQEIVAKYGGRVPDTMEELLSLRGVARKTANVVLGNCYNKNEGVVVDTHVKRLAYRFGLTKETKNVAKIEKDLMALFPQEHWTMLAHLLIAHGRGPCKARFKNPPNDPVCVTYGVNCVCREMREKE